MCERHCDRSDGLCVSYCFAAVIKHLTCDKHDQGNLLKEGFILAYASKGSGIKAEEPWQQVVRAGSEKSHL